MAKSLNNYNCVIGGDVIIGSASRFNVFQAKKILHLLKHRMSLHSFMSMSSEIDILQWIPLLLPNMMEVFLLSHVLMFKKNTRKIVHQKNISACILQKKQNCLFSLQGRNVAASPHYFLHIPSKEKKSNKQKTTSVLLSNEVQVQMYQMVDGYADRSYRSELVKQYSSSKLCNHTSILNHVFLDIIGICVYIQEHVRLCERIHLLGLLYLLQSTASSLLQHCWLEVCILPTKEKFSGIQTNPDTYTKQQLSLQYQ